MRTKGQVGDSAVRDDGVQVMTRAAVGETIEFPPRPSSIIPYALHLYMGAALVLNKDTRSVGKDFGQEGKSSSDSGKPLPP